MKRIILIFSCNIFFVVCLFAFESAESQIHKQEVYRPIAIDSVSLNSLKQHYDILNNEYYKIPVLNINDLYSYKHTIQYRSEDSAILVSPPTIGNQCGTNTCTGWAVCYAAASICLYEDWQDWDQALCSPQYLYNQHNFPLNLSVPIDCYNSYSDIRTIGEAIEEEGTCSYALMPFDTTNCTTAITSERQVDAMNRRFKMRRIDDHALTYVSLYKQIIDSGRPIVVEMPVYDSFQAMLDDTTSHGIWSTVDTAIHTNPMWHATCIVGYDDTKEAFKVMNSWGNIIGDHGYYWAKYSVVEQGCFRHALILRNKIESEIEGAPYLCDTMYHYIRNVPEGATIQWQLTNPSHVHFYYEISGPHNQDSVLIVYHIPYAKSDPQIVIPPFPTDSAMTLKVTISSGDNSYIVQKKLYEQSVGIPAISASDTASRWERNTARTFTVTNCQEVSDNMITWTIKRTRPTSPLFPPYTTIVYQATGRSITYRPTTTGKYEVIATNEAKPCGTNVSSKTYTVSYTIAGTGMEEESSSIDEESVQHLHQRITANSASYTYELWHTIYGRMRTQQVTDINEQIDTAGLPQGAYVLLEKNQNGEIVKQTKIMIQ